MDSQCLLVAKLQRKLNRNSQRDFYKFLKNNNDSENF